MRYISFFILQLLFISCSQSGETRVNSEEIRVRTQSVELSSNNISSSYIGVVKESSSAKLGFAVAGTVEQICVGAGDRVEKGELLLHLSAPNTGQALVAAQATYAQAEDGYKRAKMLFDSKSMPEIEFIDAKTKLQQAAASLAIAKKNVEYTHLLAPNSGYIGEVLTSVGEVLLPTVPVISLLDIDSVSIKIALSECEISKIELGDSAEVSIVALGDRVFNGVVSSHGVVSNPLSHTYEVMIKLENSGAKLLPGMIARVSISNGEQSGVTIPNSAVVIGGANSRYVWVVEGGVAQRREVVVGGLSSDGVVISDGLKVGDRVIVDGYQKVSVGSKVEELR